MKKIWLLLLLFTSSAALAQEHILCKNIVTTEHEKVLHQFYDLLIVSGYRAREKNDTSDEMVMEFFTSMRQMANGKAHDGTKLNNLDSEKLNEIRKMLPYNTYESGFQECCTEQNSASQDKCLKKTFMEMIYRVAIKPLGSDQDFQNSDTNQNSSSEEEFVKQYIKNRLEIGTDIAELEQRWGELGEVNKMSSKYVYSEFRRWLPELIKVAKEDGLTRRVEISEIRSLPREDGRKFWVAKATVIDTTSENKIPKKSDIQITILLKTMSGSAEFQVDGWGQVWNQ